MKFKSQIFDSERSIEFPKSSHDLSQTRQGSYDMGLLYPIYTRECIPGEEIEIGNQANVVMNPTASGVRHEINMFIDWYFVPYGCLPQLTSDSPDNEALSSFDPRYPSRNQNWMKFITGGFNGEDIQTLKGWIPNDDDQTVGSLWDHLGFPMQIAAPDRATNMVWRAMIETYNRIYNMNYRDENWAPAYNSSSVGVGDSTTPENWVIANNGTGPAGEKWNSLKSSAWEKDYFTTSQRRQQRGIAPAINVEGVAEVMWQNAVHAAQTAAGVYVSGQTAGVKPALKTQTTAGSAAAAISAYGVNANVSGNFQDVVDVNASVNLTELNDNELQLTGLAIAIDQTRSAIATQRFLERNQRNGVREGEFYRSHFGTGPDDNRGDEPQFIGRYKQQILLQDVVQTAPQTDEAPDGALGFRGGIGHSDGRGAVGSVKVKEFGILMGIMKIMPRTMYTQGTPRWAFGDRTRYDFPYPEFANLSEQAVKSKEIFPDTVATAGANFGFQGKYDEYRQMRSDAVGLMREPTGGLASWNMSRIFSSQPTMGVDFIQGGYSAIKSRVFVYTDQPAYIATIGNLVQVKNMPLPDIAQPGLMDHV